MASLISPLLSKHTGFPGGSSLKNPPGNTGDADSIPGSGRSPGGGHGNPLLYSCLENPMDRGAWRAIGHGLAKTQTWLSDSTAIAIQGYSPRERQSIVCKAKTVSKKYWGLNIKKFKHKQLFSVILNILHLERKIPLKSQSSNTGCHKYSLNHNRNAF